MPDYPASTLREVFVAGLKNAHAVEHQALALIDRQLDRYRHYPELSNRLHAHRIETERQIGRLDEILRGFNDRASAFKDMTLSLVGNMLALSHTPAPDEVLKNSFVNLAFENFEIASYTSLIALAEAGAYHDALPLLGQSLREEQDMAAWVLEAVPAITLRYVDLRADGRGAGR